MAFKLGSGQVAKLYLGTVQVAKVYLGSTLVLDVTAQATQRQIPGSAVLDGGSEYQAMIPGGVMADGR